VFVLFCWGGGREVRRDNEGKEGGHTSFVILEIYNKYKHCLFVSQRKKIICG